MDDVPIILADFSDSPKPEKAPKAPTPKIDVKEFKVEQTFKPREKRDWGVDPKLADTYLWDFIKHGSRSKDSVEVMFAGNHIGLVHLIPQKKDENSVIIQLDAAHQMVQTVVFNGRWAEPQVNVVLKKAERADKEMPQVIQDEFDQAAVDSLTRIQAQDRVQAVIDTVTALLDPNVHKVSVGALADRKDARGVSRIATPITVVFPSGTVFSASCDAIHGLRDVEIAYADPHKLSPDELIKRAQ